MASETSITIEARSPDPYRHLAHLGSGAYASVDMVCHSTGSPPSAVYARKTFRTAGGGNRERVFERAREEFAILRRLNHPHILAALEIYQYQNRPCIMMAQVAETDLAEYLETTDELPDVEPERLRRISAMVDWSGCLIQALDYIHQEKVRHKDIKPSNILIVNGQVILADFGISKDLIDQQTTATTTGNVGTLMYCAPEVLVDNHPRGRASDVFSMGCVLLEISTVVLDSKGALQQWVQLREEHGSALYCRASRPILRQLHQLMIRNRSVLINESYKDPYFVEKVMTIDIPVDISFFMLDPNPKDSNHGQRTVRTA
jgi:serine/threonine protein kinase